MDTQMDWDDLRIFLAIARTGTASEAARQLELDHSTVSRRLANLEQGTGGPHGTEAGFLDRGLSARATRTAADGHQEERQTVYPCQMPRVGYAAGTQFQTQNRPG